MFGFCVVLLAVAACHRDGLTDEQRAARKAAETIVSCLCNGDVDALVAATTTTDAAQESYHAIIADLMAEHVAAMQARRGGITSFEITRDTILDDAAQVFVVLHFADSTTEEIDVPLSRIDDKWQLR